MHRFQSFIIAYCFTFLCLSCGSWFLPPLEVLSITTDTVVTITFSKEPTRNSIEKAFTLTENNSVQKGSFSFKGNSVVFKPVNGIKQSCDYEITITTLAEDTHGNSLREDFRYFFSTKVSTVNPTIISITPSNNSELETPPESIKVVFSKPVNTSSFVNALKITPNVNFVLDWANDYTVVTINPTAPLSLATRYVVNITTSLVDMENNELKETYTSTFLNGLDKTPPNITALWQTSLSTIGHLEKGQLTTNIPSEAEIKIEFDEIIQINSVLNNISITPTINYTVTPNKENNTEVTISFNQIPLWTEMYTLKIKEGISDLSGNTIHDETEYFLRFNNDANQPVDFANAFLKNGDSYNAINSNTDFSDILLSAIDFPQDQIIGTELYALFYISPIADSLSKISAMKSIRFSATNACVNIALKTLEILSEEETSNIMPDFPFTPEIEKGKLVMIKINLEITNTKDKGMLLFSIDKNISDTLLNTMLENIAFTFNKI